jgi:S1-C subfamily serine protease
MRSEIELEAIIEDYLTGKLTTEEQKAFEQLRNNDQTVDHKVVTHQYFLATMKQYADQVSLQKQMDATHQSIDVEALSLQFKPHASKIVRFWRNNKSAVAVAASFLIFALIAIYSIQINTKQEGSFEALKGEVSKIKRSQNDLIRNINSKSSANHIAPANFGGTGFAISSNGYILTNYHVIAKADSLYVQNNKGDSFKVKAYYTDPVNDIAILKIDDANFENLGALPYSIKRGGAAIGETVYTLGYPKDDVVLGDGYVSSKTGINGDTIAYQVAIPVNPGNSGGPLLDNSGHIVGVISGKESKADGAAFAVKSKFIMEALNAIPQDSLSKRVAYGKRSLLQGLKRQKQVEKIQDYVFMIKVYKN